MLSSCASCFEVYPTSGTCPQCRSEACVCADKRANPVRSFVGVTLRECWCRRLCCAVENEVCRRHIAAVWLLVVILISYQSWCYIRYSQSCFRLDVWDSYSRRSYSSSHSTCLLLVLVCLSSGVIGSAGSGDNGDCRKRVSLWNLVVESGSLVCELVRFQKIYSDTVPGESSWNSISLLLYLKKSNVHKL